MNGTDVFAYRPVRWPLLVASLVAILAMAMLAGAVWTDRYARRIVAAASVPAASTGLAVVQTRPDGATSLAAPPAAMYWSDLRALSKLAAERHLALSSIDYQSEANRTAGVLIKHVALQVDDEYPKVKGFIAEFLRTMPNSQLEEIQIEQSAPAQALPRIQATIKLAFVYRAEEAEAPIKRGAAGS